MQIVQVTNMSFTYTLAKKDVEVNLGEGVVLQLTEKFKQTSVQHINFFNYGSARII